MRFAILSLPLIALAACAPSEDSERKRGGSPLPGLELAVIDSASDAEAVQTTVIDLSVALCPTATSRTASVSMVCATVALDSSSSTVAVVSACFS